MPKEEQENKKGWGISEKNRERTNLLLEEFMTRGK